jgi:prepilin-type N-terminal cleavage/methylation domain-containing protein
MTRLFFFWTASQSAKRRMARAGFTLIELLVVTAIVVVISGVVLANNTRFGGSVLLQNFAYDLALSIRQAQIYGIAVRRSSTGTFGAGFGMHFDITTEAGQKSYLLFADTNPSPTGNEVYDSSQGELVETNNILRGYKIKALCTKETSGGVWDCAATSLDLLFKRPEPDAYIHINGQTEPGTLHSYSRIVVVSPQGDQISVLVEANGQITVKRAGLDPI